MNSNKIFIPSAQTWIDYYCNKTQKPNSFITNEGRQTGGGATKSNLFNLAKYGRQEKLPINVISPAEQSVQIAASEAVRESAIKGQTSKKRVRSQHKRRRVTRTVPRKKRSKKNNHIKKIKSKSRKSKTKQARKKIKANKKSKKKTIRDIFD